MTRRQQAFDLLLSAILLVLGQLEAWTGLFSSHRQGPLAAQATAYAIGAVALASRRRFPLPVTLTVCGTLVAEWLIFGSPEGQTLALLPLIASYTVADREERPRALVGLGVVLGTSLVWNLSDPMNTSWRDHAAALLWAFPWIAAWLLGAYRRTRRLYVEGLVREREERAASAVTAERTRIARELHDALGHSISVMTVQAAGARRLLLPEQARQREALQIVESTGRQALAEMRRMVGVLRQDGPPADLAPPPSLEHLPLLVEEMAALGLPVEVEVEGTARPLPPGLDLTAYRLIQEALTNTRKHAQASAARVRLTYAPKMLVIEVNDDGCGGVPDETRGHGLRGMRERVAVYGGTVEAGPVGCGFAVRARLALGEG